MSKQLVTTALALALWASAASAQGLNLSWDDCGAAGQPNKMFACNVNSGNASMYASYIPPSGVNQLVGIASQIDLYTDQAVLPDWSFVTTIRAGMRSARAVMWLTTPTIRSPPCPMTSSAEATVSSVSRSR